MPTMLELIDGVGELRGRIRIARRFSAGKIKAWAHCPLHEDAHPSLAIYEDGAKCYQCDKYWGTTSILIQLARWDPKPALVYTQRDRFSYFRRDSGGHRVVVPMPPPKVWQEAFTKLWEQSTKLLWKAEEELASRGITMAVAEHYQLGWSPDWVQVQFEEDAVWFAEGLVIPTFYHDALWAVEIRTASGRPKYLRVKGGSKCPFGMGQLLFGSTLLLIEGALDALTGKCACPGVDVMGLRGTHDPLEMWRHVLQSYPRTILVMNGDDAGNIATQVLLHKDPQWEPRRPPSHSALDDLGKLYKAGYSLEELNLFLLLDEPLFSL